MTDRSYTILIVDDDEAITWALATTLMKRNSSLHIHQAHTGREAYGYIKQLKHLDLLITDIHMPQMTGLDLLAKLQEHGTDTAIIVITGYGNADIHHQAESMGAVRYFTKPFNLNELVDTAFDIMEKRGRDGSKPGFSGNLGHLNMLDIIQVNCLIRQTGLLAIKSGSNDGKIYFDSGDITHAETGRSSGEDAVFEIIDWGSGNFDFRDDVKPVRLTIEKSWEFILMEHARRREKAKQPPKSG